MKKLFSLILAGIMIFGLAACGNKPEEPTHEIMPENMTSMTAPIDALARCMLENDLDYDPQDPEFFWIALYYFTGGYGLDHEQITEEEGTYQLQIPTSVMQEHAAALFADYADLFDLPSIMKGNVSYDPDTDSYSVSRGDIGLSQMQIISYEKTDEGYLLRTHLLSTDSEQDLIQAYDVTLMDNAYADGIEKPIYFYSVKDIVPVEAAEQPDSEATVETAIFNGLADAHTAELTLPDGTVQPFQFDVDSDVAEMMDSLKEGDGVTIGYTEMENGSLKIISIE